MTAKRFTYDSKTVSILKDGEFWLDGNVDTACNHSEICNELNKLAEENKQLKQYKEAIWDCDSSKIIRANKNTGEVDLIEKELEE